MKKSFYFIALLLFFSCHQEKEETPAKPNMSFEQYKSIMKDLILAQKINEVIVEKDSVKIDPIATVYKQYHIDSVQLRKATDYYSRDPKNFEKIYTLINKELKEKLDSLEKKSNPLGKKKIKTDSIKLNKKAVEKIFQKHRRD